MTHRLASMSDLRTVFLAKCNGHYYHAYYLHAITLNHQRWSYPFTSYAVSKLISRYNDLICKYIPSLCRMLSGVLNTSCYTALERLVDQAIRAHGVCNRSVGGVCFSWGASFHLWYMIESDRPSFNFVRLIIVYNFHLFSWV
jgi:hypothetical protein